MAQIGKAYDLSKLPREGQHGEFRFGLATDHDAPAIFMCKSQKFLGKYFLYLGQQGILFDGALLRTFDTPQEALSVLRRFFKNPRDHI